MKKRVSILAKCAFILIGLVSFYGMHGVNAQVRPECNSQACGGGGIFSCYCGDSDCGGCYIPNGQGGCGTCASGNS